MKREFWYVNILRTEHVEAPAGMTREGIAAALSDEDSWVFNDVNYDAVHIDRPERIKRPHDVRRRILADGTVEACSPLELPPDSAWVDWRGDKWAVTQRAMWRGYVCPAQPRGSWLEGIDRDRLGMVAAQFGEDEASHVGQRTMPDDSTAESLACGGYRVLIDSELLCTVGPATRFMAGGPMAPVQVLANGVLVAVLMPLRPPVQL